MAFLQVTKAIEDIVSDIVYTGEYREVKHYYNCGVAEPSLWLSGQWSKIDDEWLVVLENRYTDTGNVLSHMYINETSMSDRDYAIYRKRIELKGFAPLESYIRGYYNKV